MRWAYVVLMVTLGVLSLAKGEAADRIVPVLHLATEPPASVGVLQVVRQVRLETLSAHELTSEYGTTSKSHGTWRRSSINTELEPFRLNIVRELPLVWRLRVTDTSGMARAPDVQYQVVAGNGHLDRLSHVMHSDAELVATVEPQSPRLLSKDASTALYEGGIILRMRLDETRLSGTYSGSLILTLNNL